MMIIKLDLVLRFLKSGLSDLENAVARHEDDDVIFISSQPGSIAFPDLTGLRDDPQNDDLFVPYNKLLENLKNLFLARIIMITLQLLKPLIFNGRRLRTFFNSRKNSRCELNENCMNEVSESVRCTQRKMRKYSKLF